MVAVALPMAVGAFAQGDKATGRGRAIVTIFAKHSNETPPIAQQDVSIKINGKDASVTGWTQFKGADDALELVVLIDSGARNMGRQFEEITHFIQSQGPNTKIAIGYMENGRAVMAVPLSTDHKVVDSELRLPAGPTSNPYFSLSDLARHWPSQDLKARREVVMFSDGIDINNPHFDADDPYVSAAINDSVRAGIVIYTIYWHSHSTMNEDPMVLTGGQSLLNIVATVTGGYNYWAGSSNPISFEPFFRDLMIRLANQYDLEFAAHLDRKPAMETLKLKVEGLGLQVTVPQQVFVDKAAAE